jgi:hypothetical protein
MSAYMRRLLSRWYLSVSHDGFSFLSIISLGGSCDEFRISSE